MRNFCITISLLLAFASQAQEKIQLNKPDLNRGLNVMQAFQVRKSISEFQEKSLELQDLSDLLWAANGINRPDNGKKTAPSAQNAQEVDMYVCFENGAYLYDADNGCLNLVTPDDIRGFAERPGSVLSPCIILLVSDMSRYRPTNDREHVLDMCKVDAGIVSQNISLFCAGCGLGTKPRAGMNQDELRRALNLTDNQLLILNHPVGYPK